MAGPLTITKVDFVVTGSLPCWEAALGVKIQQQQKQRLKKKTNTSAEHKQMHQEQNIGISNSSKVSKLKPLYQYIRGFVPLKH